MDTWIQRIFLIIVTVFSASAIAQEEGESEAEKAEGAIFDPEVTRSDFKEDEIDSENIEIGISYGLLSVEDFEVNGVTLATINYHVLEDIFLSFNYGLTTAGNTSYELLSGGAQLLTDEERDYTFYNVSLGYNLFPGEVFIGSKYAFNSALYLLIGAGNTEFAGDEQFTINFGFGFRFIATDWLALHVQVQDYVFESSTLGEEKLTNNFELTTGISVFF